jgi:hypothetical protein
MNAKFFESGGTGNATVMAQDGLQSEDGATIEPLARFGSLHDIPTFSLSVSFWWQSGGKGMQIHGQRSE